MSTALLVLWVVATIALALYLIYDDHRDEAERRERARGDVQPRPERGFLLFLAEGILAPIFIALLVSALVGGVVSVFYKVLT